MQLWSAHGNNRSPHAREACHHRCPPLLTAWPIWETRSARLQISSNVALVRDDWFPDPLSAEPIPRFKTDRDPDLHEHMPPVISIRRSAPSDNLELNSKTRAVSMRGYACRSSNQVLNSARIEFGMRGHLNMPLTRPAQGTSGS